MPPLPSVPAVARVDLHTVDDNDTHILNRMFFHFSGSLSVTDATTWAGAIGTSWANHRAPGLFNDVSLVEVDVTDLSSSTGARGADLTTHNASGGSGGLPSEVCMVFEFKIARRYRGGKPKYFESGHREAELSAAQLWDPSLLPGQLLGFDAFVGGIISGAPGPVGTITQVNVSYFAGFTVVVNPITHRARNVPTLRGSPVTDPVIAIGVDKHPGSQRRRSLQGQ